VVIAAGDFAADVRDLPLKSGQIRMNRTQPLALPLDCRGVACDLGGKRPQGGG